ncbi:MAG TPA: hypothetical protein VFB02_04115 [Bradyrhizobium sp.]|nr:hypothetical protein [Bradyrhizobium sp.]
MFILRFWREEADVADHARWRVLIRNINTRRFDVVDDVQRAFAVITSSLNTTKRDDGPRERLTDEQSECG